MILNGIEHSDAWPRLNAALSRFLPRFKRLTTLVQGGTIQIFLHEDGLRSPIPATRLSDGTIRFIALLAILLRPGVAPLTCLEEPELGLHPDALTLIAELLVEAAQETQIIVTTQSDVLGLRPPEKVFLKHCHFKMFWAILSHAGLSSPPCPSAQTAPG